MTARTTLRQSLIFMGTMALFTAPASASSLVDSFVQAGAEHPATSAVDYSEKTSASPGDIVVAEASCPAAPCAVLGPSATARAASDYGVNRVYAYAGGGPSITSSAFAQSFWMEELTFNANALYSGGPVTLAFHLDGSWEDASFDFDLAVFNATQKLPAGDDRALFDDYGHPIKLQEVVDISFDNSIFDALPLLGLLYPNFQVIQAAGTTQDGLIEGILTVSFTPQVGEVYTLAAGMKALVEIPLGGVNTGTADFYNSAVLSTVYLPQGLTLSTDSGTAYNVAVVPEVDMWAMLLAGLGLLGLVTRRSFR
ncbi:MAG: hypothetical protein AB1421_02535 [Pseudomonadota bacterium]